MPANPRLPYYVENRPDALGYAANPPGVIRRWRCRQFSHQGHPLSQPSVVDARWLIWRRKPGANPSADTAQCRQAAFSAFVKAYGHNGYFTSLKSIVHFYNTRDVLPRCKPNDAGEGTTAGRRRNRRQYEYQQVGDLGLSETKRMRW